MHRCLQRHDISRLPESEGKKSRRALKCYPIGYCHRDSAEVRTGEGKSYLLVAIEHTSKFAYFELHQRAGKINAAVFLRTLIAAAPLQDPYPPER